MKKVSLVLRKVLSATLKNKDRHEPGSVAAQVAERLSLFEKTVNKANNKDLRFAAFANIKKDVHEQAQALKQWFTDDQEKLKAIDRILREFDYDIMHWSNLGRDLKRLVEK